MIKIALQPKITITQAQIYAGTSNTTLYNIQQKEFGMQDVKRVILTLLVTLADRTNSDETYNFYVHTYQKLASGSYSRWDVCAFPQVAGAGPYTYTMICNASTVEPVSVTTAGPGVRALLSGSYATVTAGAGTGICTATAGMAYHGTLGEGLTYSLIAGGSTPGPITFEIQATCYS
jgi:hypothetical protein